METQEAKRLTLLLKNFKQYLKKLASRKKYFNTFALMQSDVRLIVTNNSEEYLR